MSSNRRRDFLKIAAAAGVGSTVAPAFGSDFDVFAPPADPFELSEITVAQLADGMKSGKYTARQLTQMYLQRIDAMDKRGAMVNSVIEVNPEAESIADGLDRENKARGPRGPLHGVPVLIKDNIDTGDRMMTTAGSLALAGAPAPKDSFVARKLREAGAVTIGKTNLSEWANMRSSQSTSGWSGRGGQTRNPYVLDRNPCGSSSGSGAAVSANFCAVAVGTETDGSVVCPSSANGIVGIKPTLGLISRSGIIPIAHSQDTAGPMARTVADAAALLTALAGSDADDAATAEAAKRASADYTKFLDANGLRGARIGVVRKYFGFSEAVDKALETALEAMQHAGAVLVDPVEIESIGKLDATEVDVLLAEMKADMNAYLAKRPNAPVHTLQDIIAFNYKNRTKEMPYFGQDFLVKSQAKPPLTDKKYLDTLAGNRRLAREEGIDAVMEKHNLDALVAPTGGPAWVIDLVTGDHFGGGSSQLPAVAGYPNINVPAGFIFGLPIGLSFFGRAWSEPTLIKIAYGFEQTTKLRQAPKFLPTLGVVPKIG